MKTLSIWGLAITVALGVCLPAEAQRQNRPSSLLNYNNPNRLIEGDGYMVAGQLWDTVKPMNSNEPNRLNDPAPDFSRFVHIGPNGSDWRDPIGMWPGGYRLTDLWRNSRRMVFPLFKADGWDDAGNPLRDHDGSDDLRFMFPFYGPTVAGADDPARNYKRSAQFTDRNRIHLVHEAGWPTTAGIDFKMRAHQYSVNEQNLNDFVVVEITMTNTGHVDYNGNGTINYSNNVIDAAGALIWTHPTQSVEIGVGGDRSANRFGAGRTYGYVATPDATGAPYAMTVSYANVPPDRSEGRATPPAGRRLFGVNDAATMRGYSDVWNGWKWLGVKEGGIGDNLAGPRADAPDKETIFGTHPVGEGERRGWYSSSYYEPSLFSLTDSQLAFRSATATWYEDYGKTTQATPGPNLNPNSNVFSAGTAGDVTTFVVQNPNARPNGDMKYASVDVSQAHGIRQPVWEEAWNPDAAQGNFYGGVGFNDEYTFAQTNFSGIGPFRLDVGESITMLLVVGTGFRFEGLANAFAAAEWAWERGWDIQNDLPVPPAPDILLESTPEGTALVRWTDVSGVGNPVDGYKIWRAAQFRRTAWLDVGFRALNRYHHQHEPGERPANLLDPVNPHFDAVGEFTGDIQGSYQPAEWGPYELVRKIPITQVGEFASPGGNYDFVWEDTEAIVGFTYWYYVSAYREGSFTGPRGAVPVGHIESSNFNRNGRNGINAQNGELSLNSPWIRTYPWATQNPDFPAAGTQAHKNIGAEFTVTPPVAPVDDVAELITVTPNPYKITGLNDDRSNPASHNIDFLNLPEEFTLTIIDVAGQIIFQTSVEGAVDGKFTWDMFSKDGVEVASGVYIYHLAYGQGREVTGHFAILR